MALTTTLKRWFEPQEERVKRQELEQLAKELGVLGAEYHQHLNNPDDSGRDVLATGVAYLEAQKLARQQSGQEGAAALAAAEAAPRALWGKNSNARHDLRVPTEELAEKLEEQFLNESDPSIALANIKNVLAAEPHFNDRVNNAGPTLTDVLLGLGAVSPATTLATLRPLIENNANLNAVQKEKAFAAARVLLLRRLSSELGVDYRVLEEEYSRANLLFMGNDTDTSGRAQHVTQILVEMITGAREEGGMLRPVDAVSQGREEEDYGDLVVEGKEFHGQPGVFVGVKKGDKSEVAAEKIVDGLVSKGFKDIELLCGTPKQREAALCRCFRHGIIASLGLNTTATGSESFSNKGALAKEGGKQIGVADTETTLDMMVIMNKRRELFVTDKDSHKQYFREYDFYKWLLLDTQKPPVDPKNVTRVGLYANAAGNARIAEQYIQVLDAILAKKPIPDEDRRLAEEFETLINHNTGAHFSWRDPEVPLNVQREISERLGRLKILAQLQVGARQASELDLANDARAGEAGNAMHIRPNMPPADGPEMHMRSIGSKPPMPTTPAAPPAPPGPPPTGQNPALRVAVTGGAPAAEALPTALTPS